MIRLLEHRRRAMEFILSAGNSSFSSPSEAKHHLICALVIACSTLQRARLAGDVARADEDSSGNVRAVTPSDAGVHVNPPLRTMCIAQLRPIYDTSLAMYRCLQDLNERTGALFDPAQAEFEVALVAFGHIFEDACSSPQCAVCGESELDNLDEDIDNLGTYYCDSCWETYDEAEGKALRKQLGLGNVKVYAVQKLLALRQAPLVRSALPPELAEMLLFVPQPYMQSTRNKPTGSKGMKPWRQRKKYKRDQCQSALSSGEKNGDAR